MTQSSLTPDSCKSKLSSSACNGATDIHTYLYKATNAKPLGEQVPQHASLTASAERQATCRTRRFGSRTSPTYPRGGILCSCSNDLKHTSSAWQHHMLGQCRLLKSMHVWGMLVSKGSQDDISTPDKTGGEKKTRQLHDISISCPVYVHASVCMSIMVFPTACSSIAGTSPAGTSTT